jgi:hypothetical protein
MTRPILFLLPAALTSYAQSGKEPIKVTDLLKIRSFGDASVPPRQLATKENASQPAWSFSGGSYAGCLVAWIVGHDHRFKAACAQRGVYDLATFGHMNFFSGA